MAKRESLFSPEDSAAEAHLTDEFAVSLLELLRRLDRQRRHAKTSRPAAPSDIPEHLPS
jgi:hypothetical protein